ncbi:MAG: hypothetical protein U9O97_01815 [Elusimicrobiota bacterium]|nr:hypothetical protein [Elusimicrobiota bacterium]
MEQNNKGTALIFFITVNSFLLILWLSLMKINSYQSRYSVHKYKKIQSLYTAEAGLQHKMSELLYGNTAWIQPTAFERGYYRVSVIDEDPYYIVSSTGTWGKEVFSPEKKTVLVSRVMIKRAGGVLRVGRGLSFQNIAHIYGDLYSNEGLVTQNEIHIYAKGDQAGSIFVAADTAQAVKFQNNVYFETGGQFVRTRGNSFLGESPYEHAPLPVDGEFSGVYNEAMIATPGNVTIVERDNSEYTEPFDLIPLYDIDNLSADVVYWERQSFTDSSPLSLDGKVHLFKGGVDFSGAAALTGQGTVWVDGEGDAQGAKDGVKFQSQLGDTDDYRRVNIIVTGGTWEEEDIKFQDAVYIEGYIYAEQSIAAQNEFRLRGAIEIKSGDGLFQNEVHLEYSNLIGFLPIEGGETNIAVNYVSWTEMSPAR